MTNIANLVQYEAEFPIRLKPPGSKTPINVTFWLRSMKSKPVQEIERKHQNAMAMAQFVARQGDADVDAGTIAAAAANLEIEKLCACLTRWEWNGMEFGDLGVDPECTDANKRAVLNHPNSVWIIEQIYEGAGRIANFTEASLKKIATT